MRRLGRLEAVPVVLLRNVSLSYINSDLSALILVTFPSFFPPRRVDEVENGAGDDATR